MILLNGIVPKIREHFLAFKRFSDHLDSFYAGLLEETDGLKALHKGFEVIHCFFRRLSAVEHGLKADDIFNVENQSQVSLKIMSMVHDGYMCT